MQSDNIIGIDGKSKVSLSWRGSTEDILSFRYLGVIWGYFASIRHLKVESTLTLKKLASGLEMKFVSRWQTAAHCGGQPLGLQQGAREASVPGQLASPSAPFPLGIPRGS